MTPQGSDRVADERHNQNLHRFQNIEADVRKNVEQTGRAIEQVSVVRHDVVNLRQAVDDFIWLYRDEKKERKAELDAQDRKRVEQMEEHAKQLQKLSKQFIWAMGWLTGVSFAGHFLFDLLAPITRGLLH